MISHDQFDKALKRADLATGNDAILQNRVMRASKPICHWHNIDMAWVSSSNEWECSHCEMDAADEAAGT